MLSLIVTLYEETKDEEAMGSGSKVRKREKLTSAVTAMQLTTRLSSADTKNRNIFLNASCIYNFSIFYILRRNTGFDKVWRLDIGLY